MRQFCHLLFCVPLFLDFVDASFQGSALKAQPQSKSVSIPVGKRRKVLRQMAEKPRPPLLELMSTNLENWGARAAHPEVLLQSSSTAKEEKPQDVITVSGNGHLVFPGDQILASYDGHANPLAQAPRPSNQFDSRILQSAPLDEALNFHLSNEMKGNVTSLLITLVSTLVLLLLMAYCMTNACCDASDAEAEESSPSKDSKSSSEAAANSSWARAYYEAEGEQKEAFELLFRCNIISTEEFACSSIGQEHIQECLWIGTHMLHHKPLEDWVGIWQQAQQSFEDSVAECFEARGGQVGLTARALAQRLKISRHQQMSPTASPSARSSMPSSANMDFVSPQELDLRPLQS